EIDDTRRSADGHALATASQSLHQAGHAGARDPVDHDEPQILLVRSDEGTVRIGLTAAHDDEIRAVRGRERAERLLPAEDARRAARRHGHDLTVGEFARRSVSRRLELTKQI